jgi:sulfite exporter TauE/SafE
VGRSPVVWRRRRAQSWLLVAAAVALAALGVAAKSTDLAKAWKVPAWVLFIIAAASAIGAVFLQRAQEDANQRDAHEVKSRGVV